MKQEDMEVIKKSAEAMGFQILGQVIDGLCWPVKYPDGAIDLWNPYYNDLQLMAIIRRYPYEAAQAMLAEFSHKTVASEDPDYNKAILTLVVNTWAEKEKEKKEPASKTRAK